MINPFTLSFGITPSLYINRLQQTAEIINNFMQDPPSNQVYMITGLRGSGKTVLLSSITEEFKKDPDWIVIELNPNRDLLQAMAAKLYGHRELQALFIKAKLDLSLFGIGLSIEGAPPVSDIEDATFRMLEIVQKRGKKVFLSIDEVSNTKSMRVFVSSFQIMLRNRFPVYLLMTGLYENIYDLQNEHNLTFLYRAPKIPMGPLNYTAVRNQYMRTLEISASKAEEMTRLIQGYPYAFQVLGYLYWERRPSSLDEIIPDFDQYMDEYVYSKIWSELSLRDRQLLYAIATADDAKVSTVRSMLHLNSNQLSPYRERLIRKGLIDASNHGYMTFTLPRFAEYVSMMAHIDNIV